MHFFSCATLVKASEIEEISIEQGCLNQDIRLMQMTSPGSLHEQRIRLSVWRDANKFEGGLV